MLLIFSLILLAFILFFMEIFVPGGILAIAGGILLIVASSMAWTDIGPAWGILIFCATSILAILGFFLEVKFLSRSRFGDQFSLKTAITSSVRSMPVEKLDGKNGVALTTMAPGGKVEIDNRVYTAAAHNGFIERGTPITVLQASPFKLIVTKK